jgi:hypothetical protein
MKKLLCILALFVFAISCRKEKSDTSCIDGYIHWGGNPAADGSGWNLRTGDESSSTYYILKNLPEEFQTEGLAVNACIQETNEVAPCFCIKNYSKIISIKRR